MWNGVGRGVVGAAGAGWGGVGWGCVFCLFGVAGMGWEWGVALWV